MEPETRYHFHEILRQYAYEKLVESGEEEIVRMRHLKYFLMLSEKIESGSHGIKQDEWFARAIDERDNLHAALEQAAKKDIEAGLYIASILEVVWEEYDMRSGAFWLAEFLQSPEAKQFPFARARALCAQSRFLLWFAKFPQAQRAAQESLDFFHACNDQLGEIDALTLLGASYFLPGNRAEGVKLYQQALPLSKSLGDIWRQAKANYFLGWDHSDYQRAFTYWEKAMVLFGKALQSPHAVHHNSPGIYLIPIPNPHAWSQPRVMPGLISFNHTRMLKFAQDFTSISSAADYFTGIPS